MKKKTNNGSGLLLFLLIAAVLIGVVFFALKNKDVTTPSGETTAAPADGIPAFSGSPYAFINGNKPVFSKDELKTVGYEQYSPLDSLGRCGVAIASCGIEIMPAKDEERGSISSVTPSGWVQATYDTSLVSGGYLYNRCHMIGWQLSAENANSQNIITGTKYLNINGMLPFENMIADYIKETKNHVAYRVTPVFEGNELVCRGVQLEAYSIEDNGEGICFNVYCYNVQPGIEIDYSTGESRLEGTSPTGTTANKESSSSSASDGEYVLNTKTKKIHLPTCRYAKDMSEESREDYIGKIEDLLSKGYEKCKTCLD
jgi:DNA-entry nuclease